MVKMLLKNEQKPLYFYSFLKKKINTWYFTAFNFFCIKKQQKLIIWQVFDYRILFRGTDDLVFTNNVICFRY